MSIVRDELLKLAESWEEESTVPAPHEMSNALLLKTCAKELRDLVDKLDPKLGTSL